MTMPSGNEEAADDVVRLIREYELLVPTYQSFADQLQVTVSRLCENADLPVDMVSARAKTVTSVRRKIESRGYKRLSEVTDKCGIRIVTRYQSTIEDVCELLHREFEVV